MNTENYLFQFRLSRIRNNFKLIVHTSQSFCLPYPFTKLLNVCEF